MVSTEPHIRAKANPHQDFWARTRSALTTHLRTPFGFARQGVSDFEAEHGHTRHTHALMQRVKEMGKDLYRFMVDEKTNGDGIHGGYMVRRGSRRHDDDTKFSLAAMFGPYGILDAMTPKLPEPSQVIRVTPEMRDTIHGAWNRLIRPLQSAVWTPSAPANV